MKIKNTSVLWEVEVESKGGGSQVFILKAIVGHGESDSEPSVSSFQVWDMEGDDGTPNLAVVNPNFREEAYHYAVRMAKESWSKAQ